MLDCLTPLPRFLTQCSRTHFNPCSKARVSAWRAYRTCAALAKPSISFPEESLHTQETAPVLSLAENEPSTLILSVPERGGIHDSGKLCFLFPFPMVFEFQRVILSFRAHASVTTFLGSGIFRLKTNSSRAFQICHIINSRFGASSCEFL